MGPEARCIRPNKLLQRLRFAASHSTDRFRSSEGHFALSEVLPKMGQMIYCVRIDSLLHCLLPLLVCDWHVTDWPAERLAESLDNLPYRLSLGHQREHRFGRYIRLREKSCGYEGYVFGAGERNDCVTIAPRQEYSILRCHALADKSSHVFVIGWRLKMNGTDFRPVEYAIGKPMLQVSE